jgi:hypothetical protein
VDVINGVEIPHVAERISALQEGLCPSFSVRVSNAGYIVRGILCWPKLRGTTDDSVLHNIRVRALAHISIYV